MRSMLILLTLFVCSCGPQERSDPFFSKYVRVFQDLTGIAVDVPINFDKTHAEGAVAVCNFVKFSGKKWDKKIKVDKGLFLMFDDMMKEAVILHELVHCQKGYERHNNDYTEDGVPNLMSEDLPMSSIWDRDAFRNQVKNY